MQDHLNYAAYNYIYILYNTNYNIPKSCNAILTKKSTILKDRLITLKLTSDKKCDTTAVLLYSFIRGRPKEIFSNFSNVLFRVL